MKLFVEVDREDSQRAVVRQPLEYFREISDPKGRLKARADFAQPLSGAQRAPLPIADERQSLPLRYVIERVRPKYTKRIRVVQDSEYVRREAAFVKFTARGFP